ncbi:MAG: ribosome recycling factor [Planctomycetota bacterium]
MSEDNPQDLVMLEAEEAMEKAVAHLARAFRTIRTGRATPALVENIRVKAYQSEMIMKQCGNISVPEARMLVIKPFDPSILGEIEKAILASDLGVTPLNDGKLIRLQFPPLTEERRKLLAAQVKNQGEEGKVAIRNARRDGIKELERLEKNKALTEDDLKRLKEETTDLTKKYEKKVDDEVAKKTVEIMEI